MNDKNMPQTEDQKRKYLIETLEKNFLVEAGAGSGKSTLIIDRIIHQIMTGDKKIEEIVAITFTEKASNELKLKFQDKLNKRVSGEEDAERRERLEVALRDADSLNISTIHSFCETLISEQNFDAKVGMGYKLIDAKDAEALMGQVWIEYLISNDKNEKTIKLLEEGINPYSLGGDFIKHCWNSHYEIVVENAENPFKVQASLDALKISFQEAYQKAMVIINNPVNGNFDPKDIFDKKLLELIEALEKSDWITPFVVYLKGWYVSGKSPHEYFINNRTKGALKKVIKEKAAIEFETLHLEVLVFGEKYATYKYSLCAAFIDEAIAWFVERKNKLNVLTFDDLLVKAKELLKNSPSARAFFKQKFTCIYVDEFQDTDPIQTELLHYLVGEADKDKHWSNWKLKPGALFLVGDPKQSIYRFRGADIQIYTSIKERFADQMSVGSEVVNLQWNFRSVEKICNFVNSRFCDTTDTTSSDYQADFTDMVPMLKQGDEGSVLNGVYSYRVIEVALEESGTKSSVVSENQQETECEDVDDDDVDQVDDAIRNLKPEKIKEMSPSDFIADFTAEQIINMNAKQKGAILKAKKDAMDDERRDATQVINLKWIKDKTPDQLVEMKTYQKSAIPSKLIKDMSFEQIKAIKPMTAKQVSGMSNDQIVGYFNLETTGEKNRFTLEEKNSITPDQIKVMNQDQINAMWPLTKVQMRGIRVEDINFLSSENLSALNFEQKSGMTATQVKKLTTEQIRAMEPMPLKLIEALSINQTLELECDYVASFIKSAVAGKFGKITVPSKEGNSFTSRNPIYSDFLVLTYGLPNMGKYIKAFKNLEIPHTFAGRFSPMGFMEVKKLAALIDFLSEPHSLIKLVDVLENCFGIKDLDLKLVRVATKNEKVEEERISLSQLLYCEKDFEYTLKNLKLRSAVQRINKLIEWSREVSPVVVVEKMVDDLEGVFGEAYKEEEFKSIVGTLKYIIEKLKEKEYMNFYDLSREMEKIIDGDIEKEMMLELDVSDETQMPLRIMNLHKSKGLEGNIVILVKDKKKAGGKEDTSIILRCPEDQDKADRYISKIKSFYPNEWQTTYKEILKQQSEAEEIRLLYVAATRAAYTLIISDQDSKWSLLTDFEPIEAEKVTSLKDLNRLFDSVLVSVEEGRRGDEIVVADYLQPSGEDIKLKENKTYVDITPSTLEKNGRIQSSGHEPGDVRLTKNTVNEKQEAEESDTENTAFESGSLFDKPYGPDYGTIVHRLFELSLMYMKNGTAEFGVHSEIIENSMIKQAVFENVERGLLNENQLMLLNIKDEEVKRLEGYAFKEAVYNSLEETLKEALRNFHKNAGLKKHIDDAVLVLPEMPFHVMLDCSPDSTSSGDADKELIDLLQETSKDLRDKSEDGGWTVKAFDGKIYVSGVMDLVLEQADGFIIIDHKTNRRRKDDFEKHLAKEYKTQLMVYKKIIERLGNKKVKNLFLYATAVDQLIEV